MPISRPTITDDTGTGEDGTIFSAAFWADVFDRIDAALAAFVTPFYAQAFHSTTQSLTSATLTAITFDSEDYDVTAIHSTSVNPSRMTIPAGAGGLYDIDGKIVFAAHATGIRVARIQKNGAAICTQVTQPAAAALTRIVAISARLVLVAGDYIELIGYQDSGGALNVGDAATRVLQNELSIVRLVAV